LKIFLGRTLLLLLRLARPVQEFFDARVSRRRVCTQTLRGPALSKAVTGLWRKASGAAALRNPSAASPAASGGQQQQGREAKEIRWGGPAAGLGWPRRCRLDRQRRETGALPGGSYTTATRRLICFACRRRRALERPTTVGGREIFTAGGSDEEPGIGRLPRRKRTRGVRGTGPPSPVRPAGLSERCAVATVLSNR
jgi:hypothetical protein